MADDYPNTKDCMESIVTIPKSENPNNIKKIEAYPLCRYSVVYRCVIFIQAVATFVMWACTTTIWSREEGTPINFYYFSDSGDLPVVASSAMCVLLVLIGLSEKAFIVEMGSRISGTNLCRTPLFKTVEKKMTRRPRLLYVLTCASAFGFWMYFFVKGALVLLNQEVLDTPITSQKMNYENAANIFMNVVMSSVVLAMSFAAWSQYKKLIDIRVKKYETWAGRSVDESGNFLPSQKKRFLKLAKPDVPLLVLGVPLLVIWSLSNAAVPLLFGDIFDAGKNSPEAIQKECLKLLVLVVVMAVFVTLKSLVFEIIAHRFTARLRAELFEAIVKQEVAFFDTVRTGSLCSRLSADTEVIFNVVRSFAPLLLDKSVHIFACIMLMFATNHLLTFVLFSVVPILSVATVCYGAYVRNMRMKFQDELSKGGTFAEEAFSSILTVRSFGGESKSVKVFDKIIAGSLSIGKKLGLGESIMDGIAAFLGFGTAVAVLWYGSVLVEQDSISVGDLVTFLIMAVQVALSFTLFSQAYGQVSNAIGAGKQIFIYLDREPEMYHPDDLAEIESPRGKLEFDHVHFTYPESNEPILKDVSFSVNPGQTVALVGPSGGGKSTIINLIERFYDPERGQILFDDTPLHILDPLWLRKNMALVGQEPTLFACTIKENIAYGCDATYEEVIAAAKQSNAHKFIMEFEDGYDTVVGERGARLSGGQKQRIAIARALIMNPKGEHCLSVSCVWLDLSCHSSYPLCFILFSASADETMNIPYPLIGNYLYLLKMFSFLPTIYN